MKIIYIYSKSNFENIAQPVISDFEDFKNNPAKYFPNWDSENMIYSENLLNNPILDIKTGKLREMDKKELFNAGKYTLNSNELIENGEIVEVELGEFEYIEDNQIKYNRQAKLEAIKKELFDIRLEYDVAPFEFEVDGETYLQNNRSIDQSNLTRIVVMCQAMRKTSFENWKFYTKDNSEKYVNLSLSKMMEMALIMQNQTTKSMATETLLSHKLDSLTDEELKAYDPKLEYDKAYKEMG